MIDFALFIVKKSAGDSAGDNFYILAKRLDGLGKQKIFYIFFRDADAKQHEEKVGRQYRDRMTPARANQIRSERMTGKRKSRQELRQEEKEKQAAETPRPQGLQISLMEFHTEIEKISEGSHNEWRDLTAQLQAFQKKEAAHV